MIARSLAHRSGLAFVLSVSVAALASPAVAAERDSWCREDGGWNERPTHCEVRELTLGAGTSVVDVDAAPNGGISVEGWKRDQVRILAKVTARAETEEEAEALAGQVRIDTTGGTVRAEGPRTRSPRSWWVGYRLSVPDGLRLALRTVNGGIHLSNVNATVDLKTVNGGVHVNHASGHVTGRTQNGGLHIELDGNRWDGEGLDLETSNGGVHLEVPEGYNAELETGTVNGGLDLDFPVTVQGRIQKRINVTLGSGGAPIRAVTTNGGISLKRP
jgi:hypothetical protein